MDGSPRWMGGVLFLVLPRRRIPRPHSTIWTRAHSRLGAAWIADGALCYGSVVTPLVVHLYTGTYIFCPNIVYCECLSSCLGGLSQHLTPRRMTSFTSSSRRLSLTGELNLPSKDATSWAKFRLSRLSRLAQDAKDVKDESAVFLMCRFE